MNMSLSVIVFIKEAVQQLKSEIHLNLTVLTVSATIATTNYQQLEQCFY